MVTASPAAGVRARFRRSFFGYSSVHVAALLLLLMAAAGLEAFQLRALSNSDIWLHIRIGRWILENHAIPRTGLFSQHSSLPWMDTSWGYDVLSAAAYKLLSLRAIPVLLMGFRLALAVVTFGLGGGWRGNFWSAIALSALAQYLISLQPAPDVFSILFFGIELGLLLHSRRCQNVHWLWWLPLLFVVWANTHDQFVNGLLLLLAFTFAEVGECVLYRPAESSDSRRSARLSLIAAIATFSGLATLLNPYGLRLFSEAVKTAYSLVLFEFFADMSPMTFRRPQHFVLLLLVMGAFFALGRQRSRDLFKIGLMSICALLSFRVQRDGWFVVLGAVAILADFLGEQAAGNELRTTGTLEKREKLLTGALAAMLFVAAVLRLPHPDKLMANTAQVFPVKAANFIRDQRLPGPLFNSYSWGGFLIWYLPEYPVVIDSRVNLYGDEINRVYLKVTSGKESLDSDPDFTAARVLLLERESGLAKALMNLPAFRGRYRVAYQDDMAVVLEPQ